MRAVLDTNVLVSAFITRQGSPAALLRHWIGGGFELIVSPQLLSELDRVLAYPKIQRYLSSETSAELIHWLMRQAVVADDPDTEPPTRSTDRGDDYLIALAAHARAVLVTGDVDLLALADQVPVLTPAEFLARLDQD